MGSSQKKNATTRFLKYSFIGLLFFSIVIFSMLGIYMNQKSKKTIYEVWCDGVRLIQVLLNLIREIREGRYNPNPVRRVEIPKETKGGGVRGRLIN